MKDTPPRPAYKSERHAFQAVVTRRRRSGVCMALATALALTHSAPALAATLTTFAQLDGQTPTGSISPATTGGSPPAGADDKADFTFDFTMTTPASLSGSAIVAEFGGEFSGTSLRLENDRLVFRSGGSGAGTMLYVSSVELSGSTQYRVTGSLYMNPGPGNDAMRLYLNGSDAVDDAFANHTPAVDMGGDWTGGNAYGYGVVGGGDYLIGTPGSPANTGFSAAFGGKLDSDMAYYSDTYLAVAVPEPATSALTLTGLIAIAARRRRK